MKWTFIVFVYCYYFRTFAVNNVVVGNVTIKMYDVNTSILCVYSVFALFSFHEYATDHLVRDCGNDKKRYIECCCVVIFRSNWLNRSISHICINFKGKNKPLPIYLIQLFRLVFLLFFIHEWNSVYKIYSSINFQPFMVFVCEVWVWEECVV